MGNHSENHDHHSNEKKPVAFTVPLIFALAVVLAIVLLVSIGDPSHGCECKETCSKECKEAHDKGDHSKCEEEMGHDSEANNKHGESEDTMAVETPVPTVDSETLTATGTTTPTHSEEHH